jgi:hypothetical protein
MRHGAALAAGHPHMPQGALVPNERVTSAMGAAAGRHRLGESADGALRPGETGVGERQGVHRPSDSPLIVHVGVP